MTFSLVRIDGVDQDSDLAASFGSDRGLSYGDGVFETMAWRGGKILAWPEHFARLERGCKRLGFKGVDAAQLLADCEAVTVDADQCVLKIILTRGSGGRGYRPLPDASSRRIVSAHPWPRSTRQETTKIWICTHPISINTRTAGIKHLNRLDQVLASAEWPSEDMFEGIMLDAEGHLIEGTRSNLFVVRDGIVRTPWLGRCGIEGIVRNGVLAACRRDGIETHECELEVDDLRQADEVLLTNSIIGVRSVTHVDAYGGLEFEPGPLGRSLRATLRAIHLIP